MRVLSLKQPFAHLIIVGEKRYEARSWSTPYRGRIAVHASSSAPPGWVIDQWQESEVLASIYARLGWIDRADLKALVRSAIVGTVNVVDVVNLDDVIEDITDEDFELVGGAGADTFLWRLEDPVAITPITGVNGKLNLWTLPEDLAARVEAAERLSRSSPSPRVRDADREAKSLAAWRQRQAEAAAELAQFRAIPVAISERAALVFGENITTNGEFLDAARKYLVDNGLEKEDDPGYVRITDALKPLFKRRVRVTEDEFNDVLWGEVTELE